MQITKIYIEILCKVIQLAAYFEQINVGKVNFYIYKLALTTNTKNLHTEIIKD